MQQWTFIAAFSFDDEVGGDLLRELLNAITAEGMRKALSRKFVDWSHPRGLVKLLRTPSKRDLTVRVARSGPPGGDVAFELSPDQAAVFIDVVNGAAEQRWGPLASRHDRSRPAKS